MAIWKIVQNIKSSVEDGLSMATNKPAVQMQAFFFCMQQGKVTTVDLPAGEELAYRDHSVVFSCDHNGNYMICNKIEPGQPVWYNGSLVEIGRKYYLINNDVITLQEVFPFENMFLLYCIQNEKDTQWTYAGEVAPFEETTNGEFFLDPVNLPSPAVVAGTQIKNRQMLRVFDGGVAAKRHFVFDGKKLYYQEEPSLMQRKCLSFLTNRLNPEDQLKVDLVKRVVFSGTSKKKLLENIKLDISAGEMVLILGGSGAGKTTFLNALLGTEKADATITLRDYNLYQDYSKVQRMIGFVPQKETLRLSDTVYMTVKSAALMKLPKEITADSDLIDELVVSVLTKLGIEKEADSLVSKLSGGQQKRLSIATNYISEPSLFILDEPDSGVDGYQAKLLMNNLREIADDNKIVLIISHQPDRTLELFDKIIVLAKSRDDDCGKLAFFGTPEETLAFFDASSMEGVVERIENEPDRYIQNFAKIRR